MKSVLSDHRIDSSLKLRTGCAYNVYLEFSQILLLEQKVLLMCAAQSKLPWLWHRFDSMIKLWPHTTASNSYKDEELHKFLFL